MNRHRAFIVGVFAVCGVVSAVPPFLPWATLRVSLTESGEQGGGSGFEAAMTPDGRFVVFDSDWAGFVDGDTNDQRDVFVRDMRTGKVDRISVSSRGEQGNGPSDSGVISTDGRFVAFQSAASNLVRVDRNDYGDIFVHDRSSGETVRASVSSSGEEAGIGAGNPRTSADGQWVMFDSWSDNLVADDTNRSIDTFVHDTKTGTTVRASVDSQGTERRLATSGCALSADGRYAVFLTQGAFVLEDHNGRDDVYVHDVETGETTRVSVSTEGQEGTDRCGCGDISDDGRYVSFGSGSDNLVLNDSNGWWDVFVKDRWTGKLERVSVGSDGRQGNLSSDDSRLSADGRYVFFRSKATNFLEGGDGNGDLYDLFRKDRSAGDLIHVTRSSDGEQANDESELGDISPNGKIMLFTSHASNLVDDDTNNAQDVFIGRLGPAPENKHRLVQRK